MDRSALKEQVQHGSATFPLQVYPGFLNPQKKLNPPGGFYSHWHEEMELIWVEKASGTLTVNGRALAVKPRSVFFIHPAEIHSMQSLGKKAVKAAGVVFHWRLLDLVGGVGREDFLQPLAQGRLKLPRVVAAERGWKKDVYDEITCLVREAVSRKPGFELAALGHLYTVLAKIAAAGALAPAKPRTSNRTLQKVDRVKKAMQYIFDHYMEKIAVADLAGAAGLSPFHFCRLFKTMTNQTAVEYLNRFRVERAADLLKDPGLKVLEASLDAGFTHLSYFIKTFKRFQHCTPSQYRAAHRAEWKNQEVQPEKTIESRPIRRF